ncbi:MAG: Gfo/Idh/MocA family protein [Acidimicrobiales bacterium]
MGIFLGSPVPSSGQATGGMRATAMHIGVVGGGYWGSKHLRVFASMPEVQRLTLIEQVPEVRKNLVGSFPTVEEAAELDDVIHDLDGVVIATKPISHVELGLKAMRAGVHALIEKPMATSVADAALLCREADRSGLVLMAGHTFEFNPAVVELKRRIIDGELGDIHYMRSLRLNLGLYQSDVNVIWDLAPHDVSIINYLLDEMPTTVTAWGHRSASTDFEDVAMIRMEYERSGVDAYVHVSWLDPSKIREVTVVGSEKMAVYDDVRSQERLRLFDCGVTVPSEDSFQAPMSYRYGDITSPFIQFDEPLGIENRHFVEAIRNGRAEKSDGYAGGRVVAAVEAAQRSLQQSQPISVAGLIDELADPLDFFATVPAGPATIEQIH